MAGAPVRKRELGRNKGDTCYFPGPYGHH
jgi:hypothetical protein